MAKDVGGTQLPTWKNDQTEQTKVDIHGEVPTNKRLGFIWQIELPINTFVKHTTFGMGIDWTTQQRLSDCDNL